MKPKFALFGCNPLAIEVARRLSAAGTPFAMVDSDAALVESALKEGLVAQQIDYTDDEALPWRGSRQPRQGGVLPV